MAADSEQIGAIEATLNAFGFREGDSSESCFQLNPPTDELECHFNKLGFSKKIMRLLPDTEGRVDLDCLENETQYEVKIFNRQKIPLHQLVIVKDKAGGIDVRKVDTGGTLIQTLFQKGGKPFGGASVLGNFADRRGKTYTLVGKTSEDGKFITILPPGRLNNLTAKKEGIEVPQKGYIEIPELPPGELGKPKCWVVEVDPTSFISVVEFHPGSTVMILGDVSGSMGAANQMDILKKSFSEIMEETLKQKSKLMLASWHGSIEWCTTSWITESDLSRARTWISERVPGGSNDMKNAIEDAMKRAPEVNDVYVMCDGDITPFSVDSWMEFRKRFSRTTFHFCALGTAASTDDMRQMANIGGGRFWESS